MKKIAIRGLTSSTQTTILLSVINQYKLFKQRRTLCETESMKSM